MPYDDDYCEDKEKRDGNPIWSGAETEELADEGGQGHDQYRKHAGNGDDAPEGKVKRKKPNDNADEEREGSESDDYAQAGGDSLATMETKPNRKDAAKNRANSGDDPTILHVAK